MSPASHILADLKARYAEPHRHYHTWNHLEQMGEHARTLNLDHLDEVVLAILFHDAVYDPRATDNEQRSADLMRTMMNEHASPEVLDKAETLILATANHRVPEGIPSDLAETCACFLDMDLAIFAAYEPDFVAYDEAIRKEYAHVPEPEYRRGRAQILERFLARPRIYLSEPFSALEFTARHNIQAALDKLRRTHVTKLEHVERGKKTEPKLH